MFSPYYFGVAGVPRSHIHTIETSPNHPRTHWSILRFSISFVSILRDVRARESEAQGSALKAETQHHRLSCFLVLCPCRILPCADATGSCTGRARANAGVRRTGGWGGDHWCRPAKPYRSTRFVRSRFVSKMHRWKETRLGALLSFF